MRLRLGSSEVSNNLQLISMRVRWFGRPRLALGLRHLQKVDMDANLDVQDCACLFQGDSSEFRSHREVCPVWLRIAHNRLHNLVQKLCNPTFFVQALHNNQLSHPLTVAITFLTPTFSGFISSDGRCQRTAAQARAHDVEHLRCR